MKVLRALTNIRPPALRGVLENLPAVPVTRAVLKTTLQNAGVTTNELVNAAQQIEYATSTNYPDITSELLRSLVGDPTKKDKKVTLPPQLLQDLIGDLTYVKPLAIEMRHKRAGKGVGSLNTYPYAVDHEPISLDNFVDYPGRTHFHGSPVWNWPVPLKDWKLNPELIETRLTGTTQDWRDLPYNFRNDFERKAAILYSKLDFGNRGGLVTDLDGIRTVGWLPNAPPQYHSSTQYWAKALQGHVKGLSKDKALDDIVRFYKRSKVDPKFQKELKDGVWGPELAELRIKEGGLETWEEFFENTAHTVLPWLDDRLVRLRNEAQRALDQRYEQAVHLFPEMFHFARKYYSEIVPSVTDSPNEAWPGSDFKEYLTGTVNALADTRAFRNTPTQVNLHSDRDEAFSASSDKLRQSAHNSFNKLVPQETQARLNYIADPAQSNVIEETFGGPRYQLHNLMHPGKYDQYTESLYATSTPARPFDETVYNDSLHWGDQGKGVFGHTRQSIGRPLLYEGPGAKTFHMEELQAQFPQSVQGEYGTLERPHLFNTPAADEWIKQQHETSRINLDPKVRRSLDEIKLVEVPHNPRGLSSSEAARWPGLKDTKVYTLTHPFLRGRKRKQGIDISATSLEEAQKILADDWNNAVMSPTRNARRPSQGGFFMPHPYAYTNPAEQLLARGALQQAIDVGADVLTWPMRGRELGRRYGDDPGVVAGLRHEYNKRLVNYFNQLGKGYIDPKQPLDPKTGLPQKVKVGHDRLILSSDPDLIHRTYDMYKQSKGSPFRPLGRTLISPNGLQPRHHPITERVHKLNIAPMRDIFKKGIPLSITGGVLAHPAFTNYGDE